MSRERRIRDQLARHAELMAELQVQGMTREDASRKAYAIIKAAHAPLKPKRWDPDQRATLK